MSLQFKVIVFIKHSGILGAITIDNDICRIKYRNYDVELSKRNIRGITLGTINGLQKLFNTPFPLKIVLTTNLDKYQTIELAGVEENRISRSVSKKETKRLYKELVSFSGLQSPDFESFLQQQKEQELKDAPRKMKNITIIGLIIGLIHMLITRTFGIIQIGVLFATVIYIIGTGIGKVSKP